MSLGTVQVYEPVLDVEAAITVAVAKLSFEYSSLTLGIVPVAVQVIVRLDATVHCSPPLGAVTVRAPRILKSALESSKTVESFTSVTRTRTVAEMSFGTVQANDPVFGVEAAIKIGVVKLSFEYSIFTLVIVLAVVEVVMRLAPPVLTSRPLGAESVKPARIVKAASDASVTVASPVSVIRTLTVVESASGTVQA